LKTQSFSIFTPALIGLAILTSCAQEGEIIIDNSPPKGDSIAGHSQGQQVTWLNSGVEPGAEYYVVVVGRGSSHDLYRLQHSLDVRSSQASAPRDQAEEIATQVISRNQDLFQFNFNPALPDIAGTPRFNPGPIDFYIPNPLDYLTRLEDQLIPIWVPRTASGRRTGDRFSAAKHSGVSGVFDLLIANNVNATQTFTNNLNPLHDCISRVVPETLGILGSPLDLDGKPEINLVISNLITGSQAQPLGLFFPVDRFKTHRGSNLSDSNYGEIVYLSPQPSWELSCSTTAHEIQHMLNFDHKVLRQIQPQDRSDLASQERRGLKAEELGLDEGYSHIMELLTDQASTTNRHVYNFLTNPNESSFALETSRGEWLSNSRTRGANTLLLLYALKRAGGSLDARDPITQQVLRGLVQSPERGLKNIANYLGISQEDLIEDFFSHLVLSMFDPHKAETFIPPVISQTVNSHQTLHKGIDILNRNDDWQKIQYSPPFFHPYQFSVEDISRTSFSTVPTQSMHFYRFRSNERLDSNSFVTISTGGIPFSVILIRTR